MGSTGGLPAGGIILGLHNGIGGRGPANRIGDDGLDFRLIIDREGFVAGLEVEDASAAHEAAAGTEHLSARMPGDEHQVVGLRDEELLAVGLIVRHFKVVAQTLDDGVARALVTHRRCISPSSRQRSMSVRVPSRREKGLEACAECSAMKPMPSFTRWQTLRTTSSETSL